jgi:phosphoribosylaminoimidazolecarboxamide formyltransferase/IMP cyclohydrolase
MKHPLFRRALVSVSDKRDLEGLARALIDAGVEIVSTGGTAAAIQGWGLPVTEVAEITGFPEVLDGRVRTLHPNVHMGLLARGDRADDRLVLERFSVRPFDLVIVNLYPFETALASGVKGQDLIEMIDIGGPAILRAAAKNHDWVLPISAPEDYHELISWLRAGTSPSLEERRRLAAQVFGQTSKYDALIESSLRGEKTTSGSLDLRFDEVQALRYGENPSQDARWYRREGANKGLHRARVLQGKPLSYNNLLDINAALRAASDWPDAAVCVAVKHLNPCGIGLAETTAESVHRALRADTVSVFGGIVAVNRELDLEAAKLLTKVFLECVVAPRISSDAMAELARKRDLRVLLIPEQDWGDPQESEIRSVAGGVLIQSPDRGSELQLSQFDGDIAIHRAARLAWRSATELKSNAISIASSEMTLGLGMGQVNRVDAVIQAIERWKKYHPDSTNVVMASDAFFPFADSIERAAEAGIRWIVQPGGSIRDQEVFARAEELRVRLVITGQRHFRH